MSKIKTHSDQEILDAYHRLGSKRAAADELGIARSTVQHHLKRILGKTEGVNAEAATVVVKPKFRIQARDTTAKQNLSVLAIGDCHDSPELSDKTRFEAFGRLAKDLEVDHIVQIGDFTSLDSLSSHERNDTVKGQEKPSFTADMISFQQALKAFDRGLDGYSCPKHITLGNHEARLFSYVNQNPEIVNLLDHMLYAPIEDHGWTCSPYGEFYFIGDVGFTHAPMNIMGKPYGGQQSENAIARDALHDVVYGHTHKRLDKTFPKMGQQKITVINLGTSLPEGHVEAYAKHSLTGWSYGVYLLQIKNGRIDQQNWISMSAIMERDFEITQKILRAVA